MKRARFAAVLLFLCLGLPLMAAARGLEPAEPLTGGRSFPEGAAEQDARFVFTYAYPQFTPEGGAAEGVNAYYQDMARDLASVDLEALAGEALELPARER